MQANRNQNLKINHKNNSQSQLKNNKTPIQVAVGDNYQQGQNNQQEFLKTNQLFNPYTADYVQNGDGEDEQEFLENMDKIQQQMKKSKEEILEEVRKERKKREEEERKKRRELMTQASTAPGSQMGTSGGPPSKKAEVNVIVRMDYFYRIASGFSQIQIFYGLFTKDKEMKRPTNLERTKYYTVENIQLHVFNRIAFNNVTPSKDLYLYIEIVAFFKSSQNLNKYWTICPLYTEFKTIQRGKVKLPFYTFEQNIEDLFQDQPIPHMGTTSLLAKITRPNGELDIEKGLAHNEYQFPYIHNIEVRKQENKLQEEEDRRKMEKKFQEQQEKEQLKKQYFENKQREHSMGLVGQIQNDMQKVQQYQQQQSQLLNNQQQNVNNYNYSQIQQNQQQNKNKFQQNNNNNSYINSNNTIISNGSQMYNQNYNNIQDNQSSLSATSSIKQDMLNSSYEGSSHIRPKNYPPKVSQEEIKQYKDRYKRDK